MTDYAISIATVIGIQALLTLGLNVQFGLTGIVNFGHVAFYAIGAYASAILTAQGVAIPVAILAGMVAATLASVVLGLGTLRLREDYFAIVTLGFAEALRLVVLNASAVTRGPFGIPGIPRPLEGLVASASYAGLYLVVVAAILLVALVLCMRIAGSPLGRTLRAIRDEPDAAMAVGKNPLRFRLIALLWGAALAALAGSLWAHYVTFVAPQQFTAEITFYAWIAMIVGGLGSMIGGVVGTAIVVVLVEGTRFLSDVFPWIDAPRLAAVRQMLVGIGLIALTVREYRRGSIPE